MEYVRLGSTVWTHLGSDQRTGGEAEEKEEAEKVASHAQEEAEKVASHAQEEAALYWQSEQFWQAGSHLRTLFWPGGIASFRKNPNYKAENNVVIPVQIPVSNYHCKSLS